MDAYRKEYTSRVQAIPKIQYSLAAIITMMVDTNQLPTPALAVAVLVWTKVTPVFTIKMVA